MEMGSALEMLKVPINQQLVAIMDEIIQHNKSLEVSTGVH
jgi:D-alanine-D-alanine ligase-like ATP-grasp enzyme